MKVRPFIIVVLFSFLIGGCSSSGGDDPAPQSQDAFSVAGEWLITENSKPSNCAVPAPRDKFILNVTQNGSSITIADEDGNRFNGSLSGNTLNWTGSYDDPAPDDTPGRTTLNTMSADVSTADNCNSLTGNANWTWNASDGSGYSCSGNTSFSGVRSPAGDCGVAATPASPSSLTANATSSGSIDLMWQDNADNEDNYIVERSEVSPTNGYTMVTVLPADSQSYSDTGLMPATTYYYRVASSNATGQSGYSDVASTTTDAPPASAPVEPDGLAGSATSAESVMLFWNDNSDNESHFGIYSATNPGGPFTLTQTVSANVTTVNVTGLTPATTYYFKIIAVNSSGSSPDSNIHSITTPAVTGLIPDAPSVLSVSGATSSSLSLSWMDNSSNETGFKIYRSSSQFGAYSQIATTTTSTYVNTGLSASTSYWYKVSAYNSAGESAQSSPKSGTTAPPPLTAPAAPTGLSVGSATSSSLSLSWVDNSSNETGFKIYRSTSQFGTYSQIAMTATSSYVNTGLSASTTYWYKVSAYNSAGESAQSSSKSGTTAAPSLTIPAAPSGLSVGSATSSSLSLSWMDNSNNETGFKIYRSISQFGTYNQIATTAAPTYVNTGLSASTTYWYKVTAYNSAGESSFTTAVNGTTQNQPVTTPAEPTNPFITNITSSSARLNWTDNSNDESGFQIGTCAGFVSSTGSGSYSCNSSFTGGGFQQVAQVGANVTHYDLTGLSANTQYTYYVRAYNSSGESSNTGARFTTLQGAQTVTLQAIASNAVFSNSLDGSWASTAYPSSYPCVGINWAGSLSGYPSSLACAGLVKFDITLMSGKTIDSAILDLEAANSPIGYWPQNFQISAIATPWNPSTVTWNIMSNFQYYTQSWQTYSYPLYAGQTYSVDLTTTVQNWANSTYSNHGLGFLSFDYGIFPSNITSLDAYEFYVPTLTVTYH